MRFLKFPLIISAFLLAVSIFVVKVYAQGYYTGGTSGYDISYPQGNGPYPAAPFTFGVVGVTSGRAFNDNPYISMQFNWAKQASTAPSLYMNVNAPVGSTVNGNTSSPKKCAKNDKVCQAYDYGYNAAAHSYKYALSKGATSSMWWLDIETGNSWSSNTSVNDATIQGTVDYLNNSTYPVAGNIAATVGIYSTSSMWNTIAGNWSPAQPNLTVVPNWIPGAAAGNPAPTCSQTITPNGQAWLTQYVLNNFDNDYACQ